MKVTPEIPMAKERIAFRTTDTYGRDSIFARRNVMHDFIGDRLMASFFI